MEGGINVSRGRERGLSLSSQRSEMGRGIITNNQYISWFGCGPVLRFLCTHTQERTLECILCKRTLTSKRLLHEIRPDNAFHKKKT